MVKAPIRIISVYWGRMGEAFSFPGTGTSRMRLLRTIATRAQQMEDSPQSRGHCNPRVEVQRMGVPAPPPHLTVRGRCELSRTDGLPHAMMPPRLWCYGEMSSRDNPQDKCLQSVRAFHLSIRIQADPATVVGAMPTLGCLYTRWVRRWVA